MDIQSFSINMSQAKVQEQAAVKVQSMGLDIVKEQAAAVEKLISSALPLMEPNLGQRVNILV
uniref:Motility protein n=1 Tax=uncultured bacterium contig00037 TaxID=1181525 RepID=A0A806JYS3_9BACT|nr:hypothetical protein [uncultured bacterium contig00037]